MNLSSAAIRPSQTPFAEGAWAAVFTRGPFRERKEPMDSGGWGKPLVLTMEASLLGCDLEQGIGLFVPVSTPVKDDTHSIPTKWGDTGLC